MSPSERAAFIVNDTGFLYIKTRGFHSMNRRIAEGLDAGQEFARHIAGHFVTARLNATPMPGFPGQVPETLAEAYACQDAAIAQWPDRIQGWKVGRILEP